MKKVLALLRVSSNRQDFTAQQQELANYLHDKHFSDDEIEWLEIKTSATREDNQIYIDWLEQVKSICISQNIKTIAVWHLNRLGRKEKHLHAMKLFCEEHNVNLIARDGNFSLFDSNGDSYMGGMIFNMFMSIISGDNKERAEKFKRGKQFVRKQGGYTGGQILFGYQLSSDKKWIINPAESQIVRDIFEMYLTTNYSCQKICNELNSKNILHRDVPWLATEVNRILKNRNYIGEYNNEYSNRYPAIIDIELFNKVNRLLAENQVLSTKEHKHCNFAIGLLKCKLCGRNYVGSDKQYICIARKQQGRFYNQTKCMSPTVGLRILDTVLWHIVRHQHINFLLHGNENMKESLAEQLNNRREALVTLKSNLDKIQRQIKKIEDNFFQFETISQERFIELKNDKLAQAEAITANIKYVENEIVNLQKRIDSISAPACVKYVEAVEFMNAIDWSDTQRQQARDIVRSHISAIWLEDIQLFNQTYTLINIQLITDEVVKVAVRLKRNTKINYVAAYLINEDNTYTEFLLRRGSDKVYIELPGAALSLNKNAAALLAEAGLLNDLNN